MKLLVSDLRRVIREELQLLDEAGYAKEFVNKKGKKIEYGSPEHIEELEETLASLMHARECQRRGSPGRTDLSRAVSRVRNELKKARRAQERMSDR